jgi:DNA-binding transcriptional LysR family regulator
VSTVGFALLPQWVRAFRERCPGVALELIEATGDVQLRGLARGEMDAGFMLHAPGFAPPALAQLRDHSEPLVLALPRAAPLAAGATLPLDAEVLAEPLVIFPAPHRAVAARRHLWRCTTRRALARRWRRRPIQMQTIVNLVSAGLGVAWVPPACAVPVYRSTPRPWCETSLGGAGRGTNPLARFWRICARCLCAQAPKKALAAACAHNRQPAK